MGGHDLRAKQDQQQENSAVPTREFALGSRVTPKQQVASAVLPAKELLLLTAHPDRAKRALATCCLGHQAKSKGWACVASAQGANLLLCTCVRRMHKQENWEA